MAEISRGMVRLYKEQFGRGPTKVRTDFAGPHLVVCTLENTLTPAEKRMAAMGEHQRLRDLRLYFQHATEEQFCEVVERVLDRTVRAFISGIDTANDFAAGRNRALQFELTRRCGAQARCPRDRGTQPGSEKPVRGLRPRRPILEASSRCLT